VYRHKGFTLIELMITVAIIGVIAAVAYPSYLKSAAKGRRADAKAEITKASQALERCYTQYGQYNSANCSEVALLTSGFTSAKGYYTINFAVSTDITATTFEVTATAISTGPQAKDTDCTIMALDSTGKQTSGGNTTDTGSCW
jgi:type IV pilus assembly protein PilE